MSRHYLKALAYAGFPILWDYFAWMRKFNKKKDEIPFAYRINTLKKLLNKLNRGFDVDIDIKGLENLPKEASFIVCNHLSAYDPVPLILSLGRPCTFVAKKELEKVPFAGKVINGINGLFLDRNDLKQSLRVMMKVEDDLKNKKDKDWIIFPEGTRNKDHTSNMLNFHHGTFRPAVKAGAPIVPVAMYGTFRVLKKSPKYKKYPVFIRILKPIYPRDYANMTTEEIALMTRREIQKVVDYELRELDFKYMKKIDKKYRFNKTY